LFPLKLDREKQAAKQMRMKPEAIEGEGLPSNETLLPTTFLSSANAIEISSRPQQYIWTAFSTLKDF
jgi:hypothetical protein